MRTMMDIPDKDEVGRSNRLGPNSLPLGNSEAKCNVPEPLGILHNPAQKHLTKTNPGVVGGVAKRRSRRKKYVGVTYFIQSGDTGQIKIGIATSVAKRFAAIQCHNPAQLRLLGTLEGNHERRLHSRFYSDHARGEWFNPSPDLIAYIKRYVSTTPEAVDVFPHPPTPLRIISARIEQLSTGYRNYGPTRLDPHEVEVVLRELRSLRHDFLTAYYDGCPARSELGRTV